MAFQFFSRFATTIALSSSLTTGTPQWKEKVHIGPLSDEAGNPVDLSGWYQLRLALFAPANGGRVVAVSDQGAPGDASGMVEIDSTDMYTNLPAGQYALAGTYPGILYGRESIVDAEDQVIGRVLVNFVYP